MQHSEGTVGKAVVFMAGSGPCRSDSMRSFFAEGMDIGTDEYRSEFGERR
jgi:hypothetical protein